MFISNLCGPAIVYLGFSLIYIVVDIYKKFYNKAFLKFVTMIILSLIINILCDLGYTVIAWFLVFTPIIMMTIVSGLLLKVFGTDPNEEQLKSLVKDVSNNLELDVSYQKYISGYDVIQMKNLLIQDRQKTNRIDRDEVRRDRYDDIDEIYDLSYTKEDLSNNINYDLSNNVKKFNIVNYYLNGLGEKIFDFRKNIIIKKYNEKKLNENLDKQFSSLYDNISFFPNTLNHSYLNTGNLLTSKLNSLQNSKGTAKYDPDYISKNKPFVASKVLEKATSYEDKYESEMMDKANGFINYKNYRFNKLKQENPNVKEMNLIKTINLEWKNKSDALKRDWNS